MPGTQEARSPRGMNRTWPQAPGCRGNAGWVPALGGGGGGADGPAWEWGNPPSGISDLRGQGPHPGPASGSPMTWGGF